jgi:hypothetical protein
MSEVLVSTDWVARHARDANLCDVEVARCLLQTRRFPTTT